MRRPSRLIAVAASVLVPTLASAQIFLSEPVRAAHGTWNVDVGGQLARPVGEFRGQVDRAWGAGASVRYHARRFAALGLRADVSYLNYGNENKRVPLSQSVNRVLVDMSTTNNIAVFSGGPELALTKGPVRPYAFAYAGYSYFFTQSSAGDDGGEGSFASSTNYGDGGLATGWGGGVQIPLQMRAVRAFFDAGARFTRNGTRSYLRRGDIVDQPDGSLQLNTRTTVADFWQYHVGLSFQPRGR